MFKVAIRSSLWNLSAAPLAQQLDDYFISANTDW